MRCCPNGQLQGARTKPDYTQTGHIEISELDIVRLRRRHPLSDMFIKSIWIGFIGVVLFVASASAASSVLQGIVKDAKGHPIQGADIRIEATNTGRLLTTVTTNVSGRYSLEGLPSGKYRVTLVVNGAVKASINNTTLYRSESKQLNFELTQTRASVTVMKGTHRIWVPPFTGSRLPGRWIEVDDSTPWAGAHLRTDNVVQVSAEELQREANSKASPTGY